MLYNGELYHHGIKGMKWGIRRFQKKNGQLTNAGKKRYKNNSSTGEKTKSIHRRKLEEAYQAKGMSREEAERAADKRIKVEKVIAGTAAVTVAACAAYYARNKWLADNCDQILKKGTQFHNLDGTANERPGEHLYVNYRQNDTNFFRGRFALNKIKNQGHVFDHVLTAEQDVKIPSLNTRKSVFKQLYDSDPEFREVFKTHSGVRGDSVSAKKVYKNMWPKFGDKNDPAFNVAKRKYFDALTKKGYDAIVDEFDTRRDVFRSDAPLILLNTSSKSFGKMTIKELQAKDILISQANSKSFVTKTSVLNTLGAPHANNFKESSKYLKRYSAKNIKNTKRINEALNRSGMSELNVLDAALKSKGGILSDAGKYLLRDKNMSADAAIKRATTKRNVKIAAGVSASMVAAEGMPFAAAYALNKVATRNYVQKYVKEHPNTKLTIKEIEKLYTNKSSSSSYTTQTKNKQKGG